MRKAFLMLGLLSMAALASCNIEDELQTEVQSRKVRATLEQTVPEASTRAFAEYNTEKNKYYISWNEDDRISVFAEKNRNRQYVFDGFDGAPSGSFSLVEDSSIAGSDDIETGYDYAIYPYDKKFNSCTPYGTLTVTIPTEQTVHDGEMSGIGARMIMVARDNTGDFSFKHVGSYIGVSLTGKGVRVASISFQGNNSETIAGLISVTFDNNGDPVTEFNPSYTRYQYPIITMAFKTPVELSSEETVFWLAVPSVTLSNGYTLTVTDTEGGTFEKKTTSSLTLKRKNFYHCRAEVETSQAPDNGAVYTKVSSFINDGTYLVVDIADNLVFKGTADGSSASVSPEDGVIIDPDGSMAAYEFTVENSGNNYYLKFNDGKYLICDYSNSGNTTTGNRYVNSRSDVRYPYTLTVSGGAFFFNTTREDNGSANQYLYYKTESGSGSKTFKIGESGSNVGVHLYLKTDGKQFPTLEFAEPTITWSLDEGYEIGKSYPFPQTVSWDKTSVTYSSENEEVATISNNQILIVGPGSTIIRADAIQTDDYYAGSASYTLSIADHVPEGWQVLGPFNLENKAVKDYLDYAEDNYTDDNEKDVTNVVYYATNSSYSSITRKDCPAPVTITWTNSATASTVVTIYEDQALSKFVWSQNATRDAKSVDVYGLIPGRTYYYTVSEGSSIWEKGYFNTTGRRRMIKVSDNQSTDRANNCRDLGGMITKDGKKRIKYGYIFRGSNMDNTTPAEKSILVDFMKIRMDIDLRVSGGWSTQAAHQEFTSPEYTGTQIGYLNRGFSGYNDLSSDAGLQRVGDIINTIIDTVLEGNAVYFHCYVGADRTGIIGVMLEGLLGISEKDCSIDYELTTFSRAVGNRPRDGSENDHYFSQGLALLRKQTGTTFQDKCNSFLTSSKVGVSQAKIDQFKSFILENN